MKYKMVDLKDGEPIQYLGVYLLQWKSEWGDPTFGLVEDEESDK
jgi:hypothetical protein